ncbi:MAG: methyltransferase [Actinobacteria bacterium]|uniref:Unannotated protein n=1 Tax=freshwater metagenome TaxID=449393 RepID=A0A6J6NLA4_9ZZZZ|nr:methyltransferase [Actinomycetota bacterium]
MTTTERHPTSPVERLTWFGHLRIAYDERVLEPRAWTADQSRWAADLLRAGPSGPVLELCSGAGQIGLLAVALEPRPLVCVDASPVACAYARRNADATGWGGRVEVREGRLDEMLAPQEEFAMVIADPPWVPHADTGRYPADPLLAIDGGDDGLGVARECLSVASQHLLRGGSLVLQLGTTAQATRMSGEASAYGDLVTVDVRPGERGVLAHLRRP